MDDYLPIAEHGLIGDLHTVALVGVDGTIDWYCCPRFDSPSMFGAILDRRRGGWYRIAPARAGGTTKQLYFPDTNVLITRFLTPDGVGEVQDFMPISQTWEGAHRHRLIRRVIVVRGALEFAVDVQPRFNYARDQHELELYEHGAVFRPPELTVALETEVPLTRRGDGAAATFALRAGEQASFVLEQVGRDYVPRRLPA